MISDATSFLNLFDIEQQLFDIEQLHIANNTQDAINQHLNFMAQQLSGLKIDMENQR